MVPAVLSEGVPVTETALSDEAFANMMAAQAGSRVPLLRTTVTRGCVCPRGGAQHREKREVPR